MEAVVANLEIGKARRVTKWGREWYVAPATLVVPGVLNGSQGPLYYPPEEISNNVLAWNGTPLVVYHPTRNGVPVSGRDMDVWEESGVGWIHNAVYNDKLVAEAWFDIALTKSVDSRLAENVRILPRLEAGKPIELSTGLFTDNVVAPEGYKDHRGQPYNGLIARNYRPDHVAVLPDQKGACSIDDGCGINNAAPNQPRSKVTGKFKRMNAGTGKGEVHMAAQGGAMVLTTEDTARGADAKAQAEAGHNPPGWAVDEAIWEKAKEAADKGEYDEDTYWAVVAHIYQRMGGTIGSSSAENALNKEGNMHLTQEQRQTVINYLTTNCDCWKGKDKVLGNREVFSDDDLIKLKTNVEKHKTQEVVINTVRETFGIAETVTLNEMPEAIKKAKEEEEEEGAKKDMGSEGKTEEEAVENNDITPAQQQAIELGLANSLGFGSVSQMKAVLNTAKRVELERRQELVRRLVSNLEGEARTENAKWLMGKDVDELERMVALMPSLATNTANGEPDLYFLSSRPNYVGAAGGPPYLTENERNALVFDLEAERAKYDPWVLNRQKSQSASA